MQDAGNSDPWESSRRTMVDRQIRTFDVTDSAVIDRMLAVPREKFLPASLEPLAYSDSALLLPGAAGERPRSLLPPLVLARLLQGARLLPTDKALVVAAGSGYSTALVAGLAADVVAVESDPSLYGALRGSLDAFGLTQVRTLQTPLVVGAPNDAPFDVILIDGGVAGRLDPLLEQLKDGGRLVTVQQMADGAGKAVRYDKADGATGYRILFDASAPVLDAFRPVEEFTFS